MDTTMQPKTLALIEAADSALQAAKAALEFEATAAITSDDPAELVRYYADLEDATETLRAHTATLSKLSQDISYNQIPTLFDSKGIQNVRVTGYGLVSLVRKWSCSMIDKNLGLRYLRDTGQGGMIQDYVAPMTLASWAKAETEERGKEPPDDVFKTSINRYCSLRRAK
jgi:hypothetical protein